MTRPRVAVLIGVHNGSGTIDRCLESIVAQTYRNWVIVCVNDASTDATARHLSRWKRRLGSRLRVIRNRVNLGLTASLNLGLAAISEKYTARIDADDWWHPEKLMKQVAFLEQQPEYGVVGCHYRNIGPRGERIVRLWETDSEIRRGIIKRNPFAHSCVVFRTALVQSLGGYDATIRYAQDYDLWWRCWPKTKFANLPEVLCSRSVGQGISVAKQRQQMLQGVRTQRRYIQAYRLPHWYFLYSLELLVVALTPAFLRELKRKVIG